MSTVLFKSIVFLVLMTSTFFGAKAQEAEQVSGLIMEIKVADSSPLIKFPLRKDHSTGFWSPMVTRIKDWQPPVGKAITEAVSFSAILVGEKVRFKIALKPKTSEVDEWEISNYVLAVGERIEAKELRKYGYEPITASVRKVGLAPSGSLTVENRTDSIRVTVDPAIPKSGEIAVRFTNISKKPVLAVSCQVHQAGYSLVYCHPMGEQGKAVIEPNGTHDSNVSINSIDASYGGVTLVIRNVMFEDGTYEGNPGPPAVFRFYQEGQRMALERVLLVVRNAQNLDFIDIKSTVSKIDGIREKLTNENANVISSHNNLLTETSAQLRLLESISAEPTKVRQAIDKLAEDYQRWLDRLSRVKR